MILKELRAETVQHRAHSWSSIGGDQWSIDSRDGTFLGCCAARVQARSTRTDSMNSKETRYALPFLPSPSKTAESRLVIVPRTQTINETRGSESQGADNRRGMSSNRERDSWVRFKEINASHHTAKNFDYVRLLPLTAWLSFLDRRTLTIQGDILTVI